MKIAIAIIPLTVFILSCKQTTNYITIQEEAPYSLINDFIIDSLYKTNLLAFETIKFWNSDLHSCGPPNTIFYCSYGHSLFDTLIKSNIIDSLDRSRISDQMSLKDQLVWDTKRVRINTFSIYLLDQLIQKNSEFDAFDYISRKYHTRNYLFLSNPIFLNDNDILLAVSYICGGLCGHGEIYVFSKRSGKWTILYKHWNWMS